MNRVRLYWIFIFAILIGWSAYMQINAKWVLFVHYWVITLTMILGSFVAGATAEGGAAVAFPVFTKVFHIPAHSAAIYGLLIQSIGMGAAMLFIILKRITFLKKVVFWVVLGGGLGVFIGTKWINVPAPYPKVLFSTMAMSLAFCLILNRWVLRTPMRPDISHFGKRFCVCFLAVGVIGGIIVSKTGSGIDMLAFIYLTLMLSINEKNIVPTTVIIMAIISLMGAVLHLTYFHDVPHVVWSYWLVSVPVVIFGAPLGAYVVYRLARDYIIFFLVSLIFIDVISTVIIVHIPARAVFICLAVFVIITSILLATLIYRFCQSLPPTKAGSSRWHVKLRQYWAVAAIKKYFLQTRHKK